MSDDQMPADFQITRRKTFALALAGGGALLLGGAAAAVQAATNKMPQKTVAYRATPNGAARCDNCLQWQAPAACKVVAGTISASGWCSIYAKQH